MIRYEDAQITQPAMETTITAAHRYVVVESARIRARPLSDTEVRELEDRIDREAIRAAQREPGEIPWEQAKARLGH